MMNSRASSTPTPKSSRKSTWDSPAASSTATAPVSPAALQAYIAAGISSDHEATTADEAREKLRLGMQVFIREGSAARNLEALLLVMEFPQALSRFCFCTDDRHPADLATTGTSTTSSARPSPSTSTPSKPSPSVPSTPPATTDSRGLGAVAPGYRADLFVFDDLNNIQPRLVYRHGEPVARDSKYLGPTPPVTGYPKSPVRLPADLSVSSFAVRAPGGVRVRVIGMDPHQLITEHLIEDAKVAGGCAVADPSRDILKIAVIERHHATGNIGIGFVKGFKFRGARSPQPSATMPTTSPSWETTTPTCSPQHAHCRKQAEDSASYQAATRSRSSRSPSPPSCPINPHRPSSINRRMSCATQSLGCPHHDPFMPLSFMPLPVIPNLKLSDRGPSMSRSSRSSP
ncbi:MAG: adenine deaminase C-terminal domain-containing protein [Phycisphaerales bacterium]